MIDLIAYEAFGYWDEGVMGTILTMPENASLRGAGQKLDVGDVVWLPDIEVLPTREDTTVVRLWDQ